MNIYINESPIHGKGVFAHSRIKEDEWQYIYGWIYQYKPIWGRAKESATKALKDFEQAWTYGFEWDDDSGFVPFTPWRYLNHSADPNCEVAEPEDSNGNSILIVTALCSIAPNKELTIDYGYDPKEDS